MIVYQCSNPHCAAIFSRDPLGHCPKCILPTGVGFSTIRRQVIDISAMRAMAAERSKPAEVPPVDRTARELVSGAAVPEDQSHTALKPNGQQQDYIVLSAEERAKGFVRPVRRSYQHVGIPAPKHPLRDLSAEQSHLADEFAKFEEYPKGERRSTGRYWTQAEIDSIDKGCGTITTMSQAIAET